MLAPPQELAPPPRGNPGSATGYHRTLSPENDTITVTCILTVADPGFPPGRASTYDFAKFSQNCMKLKEFGPGEGGARPEFFYVDSPLIKYTPRHMYLFSTK